MSTSLQCGLFDEDVRITSPSLFYEPCICKDCLMWWSRRCPYGGCYDDHRAKVEPWPGPVRKTWTNWNLPGEQAHWCRGGIFYPISSCEHYVRYERDKTIVRTCLLENVQVFQDGYILCGLVNILGCKYCYEQFEVRYGE